MNKTERIQHEISILDSWIKKMVIRREELNAELLATELTPEQRAIRDQQCLDCDA